MAKRLVTGFKERLRKFGASESGVAAVEFALCAPPFLLMLGVIIETGLMMFTEYALQSAVQDASRVIRTGQASAATMTAAQFKTKICATASVIIDCTGGVTVYVRSDKDFATLQSNLPSFLNIGPSVGVQPAGPTCYNIGQPIQPAAVVATYDWYFSMLGMSFLGNIASNSARRLVGFAIFRNEPYPGSGGTAC